jgi:hypothetical protein
MALKSFAEFNKLVKKIAKKNAVQYQRDFTVEVGGDIARYTPVDTGRATANWTGSINAPDVRPIKKYDTSASASPTKRAIRKSFAGSKLGDDLYVSNGVQGESDAGVFTGEGYIQNLDSGEGSAQARYGMTGPVLARVRQISKKVKP